MEATMAWWLCLVVGLLVGWLSVIVLVRAVRRRVLLSMPPATVREAIAVLAYEFERLRPAHFLTWWGFARSGQEYEITVQRKGGVTPAERIIQLEGELQRLKEEKGA